jgi:glycosyltransferase involved in cell wall biosynthesis
VKDELVGYNLPIMAEFERVALIGPTYPYRGGIAHYTTLLAETLRQGHETLLISFSQQYPAWLFPGRDDRDPSKRPLRTEAEYLLNPLNPFSWQRTLRRLREWQPDLVVMQWWHPFWFPAWSYIGRGVRRLPGRPPLIYLCHNILPHEEGGRLSRAILPYLIRFTLRPASGFVTHSQSDKQILARMVSDHPITVSPLPTYTALGKQATTLPIAVPEDRPLLLFAGFVRPYKGLDVLLDALALVEQPCHLLVAGEFWQGTAVYETQIARLDIADQVTLLDEYLSNETLAACLRRANVVVLPYRSATQSAVVQLAFGAGCPVITTDVGGLAEVVANGRTGLIVPPEDPPSLAKAIEQYFTNGLEPFFRQAISEGGNHFSWKNLENTLIQLGQQAKKNENRFCINSKFR